MGPRGRRARRRGLIVGAAVGSAAARRGAANDQQAQDSDAASSDGQIAQLEKLGQLRDQGILTEDEFQAKKKQILGL